MSFVILLLKVFHWVLVAYNVVGWMAMSRGWLLGYLIFVPLMVAHWRVNNNTCVINNIESWLLTGHWRSPSNAEEGAFVRTAVIKIFGQAPSPLMFDIFIYGLLAVLWMVAFVRWRAMAPVSF